MHALPEYVPFGHPLPHGRQAVLPAGAYLPPSHAVHWMSLLAPHSADLYHPEGQVLLHGTHVVGDDGVHTLSEYVPFGHPLPHGRQAVLPAGAYLPPSHALQ